MHGLGTLEMLILGVTKHFACMLMEMIKKNDDNKKSVASGTEEICVSMERVLEEGNPQKATVCLVHRPMGSKASEADSEDLSQGVVC